VWTKSTDLNASAPKALWARDVIVNFLLFFVVKILDLKHQWLLQYRAKTATKIVNGGKMRESVLVWEGLISFNLAALLLVDCAMLLRNQVKFLNIVNKLYII